MHEVVHSSAHSVHYFESLCTTLGCASYYTLYSIWAAGSSDVPPSFPNDSMAITHTHTHIHARAHAHTHTHHLLSYLQTYDVAVVRCWVDWTKAVDGVVERMIG